MGRKRKGSVAETTYELQALAAQYRDTPVEPRIQFLLALKERADIKAEAIVGELGYSERTVRRWWRDYLSGGLPKLIGERAPVVAESQVPYIDPEALPLLTFLNAMPMSCDLDEWRGSVESALTVYLPGVQTVRIYITELDSIPDPDDTLEYIPIGEPVEGLLAIRLSASSDVAVVHDRVDELRPFISFLCTDAVARVRAAQPPPLEAETVLTAPLTESLTPKEQQVLQHRLHGFSYSETAARLDVSEERVHSCVKAIYEKTGTSTLGELFLRYFTSIGPIPKTK
jgi:DNA-binding CsgD family transcriptional regulator